MTLAAAFAGAASSATLPIALVTADARSVVVSRCIDRRLTAHGPPVAPERLSDGLEIRLTTTQSPGAWTFLVVAAHFKPDFSTLQDADHTDPEAQSAAAAAFYQRLRVPLGARAWRLDASAAATACREAAAWIETLVRPRLTLSPRAWRHRRSSRCCNLRFKLLQSLRAKLRRPSRGVMSCD